MTANEEGDPSYALSQELGPELRVKHVAYRGVGQCEEKPEAPVAPPKANPTNFSPIPRNQVDHINATQGQLLIFTVPDVRYLYMYTFTHISHSVTFYRESSEAGRINFKLNSIASRL